jgi:hypothetical protein
MLFLSMLLGEFFSFFLKFFGYIELDLFSYLFLCLADVYYYCLDTISSAIKEFLKEKLGVIDLEIILDAKGNAIKNLSKRLITLEKQNKLFSNLKKKLEELNRQLELIVAKIFNDIKNKYDDSKGVALEELYKLLKKEIEWIREDVEKVISLEHKNLAEKVKKYLENLTNKLKEDLQINEETIEEIIKRLLEASKATDETGLADK